MRTAGSAALYEDSAITVAAVPASAFEGYSIHVTLVRVSCCIARGIAVRLMTGWSTCSIGYHPDDKGSRAQTHITADAEVSVP